MPKWRKLLRKIVDWEPLYFFIFRFGFILFYFHFDKILQFFFFCTPDLMRLVWWLIVNNVRTKIKFIRWFFFFILSCVSRFVVWVLWTKFPLSRIYIKMYTVMECQLVMSFDYIFNLQSFSSCKFLFFFFFLCVYFCSASVWRACCFYIFNVHIRTKMKWNESWFYTKFLS